MQVTTGVEVGKGSVRRLPEKETVRPFATTGGHFPLSANYGYGEPTWERPWSDTVIEEGPYAGEKFGLSYDSSNGGTLRNVADGTDQATLTIPEDYDGGETVVEYMVKSGSEQKAYILPKSITVATDCEPNMPTSKDDCKNGGWRDLVDDRGNSFRNQGSASSS